MTTLMRNGRDRRSGKPVKCHARKGRALLVGTRSANHIRASGHSGCTQRPDTWLHASFAVIDYGKLQLDKFRVTAENQRQLLDASGAFRRQ
jgi:hypothetical protein